MFSMIRGWTELREGGSAYNPPTSKKKKKEPPAACAMGDANWPG